MSPRHRAAEPEIAPVDVRFVTRGLSPEEVAAVTAVLTAALQQHAADARVVTTERPSEWSRSTRGLRRPLRGDWRGFTAEGL